MRPENIPPNPHPAVVGNYSIPADNPYIGRSSFNGKDINPEDVRTEFYAVGLRNAWRFSFDSLTGELYCNDTGDFTREEVNLIEKGGNYGWAYYEGTHLGPKWKRTVQVDDYVAPLAEYGREQGNDIAAGLLYRGEATPALDGRLVFSDFWNGYIGSVDVTGPETGKIEWLFWDNGIADMSYHPRTGEILMADWFEGSIRTLKSGPDPSLPPMPAKLSETGLFQDLETLTPAEGLVPYDINVSFWSDNAIKQRWFSLPKPNQFFSKTDDDQMDYPTGTIWVKHFDLELKPGDATSRQRLETRVMYQTHFGFPYGVTYRWGDSLTDAELVPPSGLDETFTIEEETGPREQVWRYPSRRECASCHRSNNSGALGFSILQLNRTFDYGHGHGPVSQLDAMNRAGYFSPEIENVHILPALVPLDDESQPLEARARSYLNANCSSCHQKGKLVIANWDARYADPLSEVGLLGVKPRRPFGLIDEALIAPGAPDRSVLFERISQNHIGRMPPISTSLLDQQGMDIIRRWIEESVPARKDYVEWAAQNFLETEEAISHPFADPDEDQAINYLEYLTATNPKATNDEFRLQIQNTPRGKEITFRQGPDHYYEVQWSASIGATSLWHPLNEPENRPVAVRSPTWKTVTDRSDGKQLRYYRVTIKER